MDLSGKQIHLICLPTGAFFDTTSASFPWHPSSSFSPQTTNPNSSPPSWSASSLNPALRIETLDLPPHARWRIDGCDSQGTQLYAIPLFIDPRVPRRIDAYIPSQDRHPTHLRGALDSAWSFCIKDSRAAELGIVRHVLRALEHWVDGVGEEAVRDLWNSSPFGSRIVIDTVRADPKRMRCRLVKDFESERQMLSLSKLQELWELEASAYPATVDIEDLMLVHQLHDTISLVELPPRLGHGNKKVVFKSTVHEVKYMYHELRLLLTMPPHPGVMPKPLYLVTGKDRYGGEGKVFGFILPFFEGGNLADELSRRKSNGTLRLKDQFRWARQITETLKVINGSTAKFYSELKADNLLLDKDENVLFIDFEQMGNWITYSAPEIHYMEYCARLAKSPLVPDGERKHYRDLLASHTANVDDTSSPTYDSPSEGYYTAWKSLSESEREAAEVFSLGKTLWCIFEGCADTRNSVLKAFKFDDGQEFPEYRRTPPKIQNLIRQCTRGNRDGEGGRTEVMRVGDMVFPRGRTGRNGEPMGTEEETVEAAKEMWQIRVKDMEHFLLAKTRWKNGTATEEDENSLGFMLRPSLDQVLEVLVEEEVSS